MTFTLNDKSTGRHVLPTHHFLFFLLGIAIHISAFSEATPPPTISVNRLPAPLLKQYEKIQPQLTDRNRCFVVFSDEHDEQKMLLECSFNTRIAAESERRALKYCDEKRMAKGLHSPCRLVVE
jgi:hypothetical protein